MEPPQKRLKSQFLQRHRSVVHKLLHDCEPHLPHCILAEIFDYAGPLSYILKGHSEHVTSVSFSSDGRKLVSTSGDKFVRIWDLESGIERNRFECLWGSETASFSPNGKMLAFSNVGTTIQIVNVETSERVQHMDEHHKTVRCVTFSPNGKTLASASEDHTVRIWDVKTGDEIHCLRGHTDYVTRVCFSPCGTKLASCSYDKTSKIWNLSKRRKSRSITARTLRGHQDWVNSVSFTPSGQKLASASNDCSIKIWNVKTGRQLRSVDHGLPFTDVSFILNGPFQGVLVSRCWDDVIRFWKKHQLGFLQEERNSNHMGSEISISISPCGSKLAYTSKNDIKILDLYSVLL